MRSKPTEFLALGNALHLALELAHKREKWDLKFAVETFLTEFRRIVEEDEVFVTWPKMRKHEAEGVEMLERYDYDIQSGKIPATPFDTEKEFKLPFEDEIVVVGKIDKVERTEEGRYIIIDYKSGGKEPDEWFLDHDLQLTTYAWACQSMYGELPEKLIWHHLRSGKLIETHRTQRDIDELKKMLHDALDMNRRGVTYRVYHQQICGWCEFKGAVCDDRELEDNLMAQRAALKVIQ